MRQVHLFVMTAGVLVLLACAGSTRANDEKALETVETVDLERYLGRWYEIARYPAWFQKNCTAATADYSLREDGLIKVVNSCRKGSLDGKLKVSFFGPFWGPYWIIDLDPNYQWAVVGVPNRKYLWILSRTLQMSEELYAEILARLPAQGYDPGRLSRTPQPNTVTESAP